MYQEILEADPKDASAYLGLGQAALHLGRYVEALQDFRRADDIEESAESLAGIARALAFQGHLEEARPYVARSLKLDREQDKLWLLLSTMLFGSDEYQKSLDSVNAAISRDEREPDYVIHRALVLGALGRHRESIAALEQADRLGGNRTLILARMGDQYRGLGRLGEAIRVYEESIAIDPSVTACLGAAQAYGEASRFLDEAEMYGVLDRLDPANRDEYRAWMAGAYRNESRRLVQLNDYSAAERYAREALNIEPEGSPDHLVGVLAIIALDSAQRGMNHAALQYVAEIRKYDRHKAAELEELIR